MNRTYFLIALSGAVVACGESGPQQSPIEGIWQLRAVNDQGLPAASVAFRSLMAGGLLRLVPGTTWSEFCMDRGAGEMVPFHRTGAFQELGTGRGLLLYYSSSGAGSIPSDTLVISGDQATLHFRQGAAATDILRFDRIAGTEMAPGETPGACSHGPSQR